MTGTGTMPGLASLTLTCNENDVRRVDAITKGLLQNYQIGKIIGQGAYASVRLCLDKQAKDKYAMKIYEKHRLTNAMKRKAV